MSHILHCTLPDRPEALERLLQVIRIRGFRVRGLQVEETGQRLHIELKLSGERSLENLVKQMEKLVGISPVRSLSGLETTPTAQRLSA